jgi:hypothetical protein
MYFYQAFNLIIESEIAIPSFITVKEQKSDIKIILGKVEIPTIHEISNIARHGLTATYGEYNSGSSDCFMGWGNKLNVRATEGKTITLDILDPHFVNIAHLFAESEAIGMALFQKGYLLIHASAITLDNGKGIVIMGEPGMGKSTTCAAFVKDGCTLITDDLVAIKVEEGIPYLVPSYPQLKIWGASVKGLTYEKPSLRRLVEGIDKYAYRHHPNFTQELVPIQAMYELYENLDEEVKIEYIHIPMRMICHMALPKQLLAKNNELKKYFERCLAIAPSFEFYKKPKMRSFEELKNFVSLLKQTK